MAFLAVLAGHPELSTVDGYANLGHFLGAIQLAVSIQPLHSGHLCTPFLTGAFINYLRQLPATLVAER
jgi:hypothetical protein